MDGDRLISAFRFRLSSILVKSSIDSRINFLFVSSIEDAFEAEDVVIGGFGASFAFLDFAGEAVEDEFALLGAVVGCGTAGAIFFFRAPFLLPFGDESLEVFVEDFDFDTEGGVGGTKDGGFSLRPAIRPSEINLRKLENSSASLSPSTLALLTSALTSMRWTCF